VNSSFAINIRRREDTAVVEIRGEVDLANAARVEQAIRDAEETEIGTILIDLSGVTFLDSTGLSVLLRARNRDRELLDRLRFVPSEHDQVTRILGLTGASEMLDDDGA
jgi:anti-sigma B factor antagonist